MFVPSAKYKMLSEDIATPKIIIHGIMWANVSEKNIHRQFGLRLKRVLLDEVQRWVNGVAALVFKT